MSDITASAAARLRGGGRVLPDLKRRREAEATLWLTPVEENTDG